MLEVVNCIIHRGLEAGRKFSKTKPSYNTYLGIIWEVKNEFENKNVKEKNKRAEIDKEKIECCRHVTDEEKKVILGWLDSRGIEWSSLLDVPPCLVSDVCGEILELRLLR